MGAEIGAVPKGPGHFSLLKSTDFYNSTALGVSNRGLKCTKLSDWYQSVGRQAVTSLSSSWI